jgi:hypothetical protein
MIRYNQSEPSEYIVNRISSPVAIFCGDSDPFTHPQVNFIYLFTIYIVTCTGVCCGYTRVLDRMVGFVKNLYTPLGTTRTTALSLIYTLYSSPLHMIWFSVFASRILAKDL